MNNKPIKLSDLTFQLETEAFNRFQSLQKLLLSLAAGGLTFMAALNGNPTTHPKLFSCAWGLMFLSLLLGLGFLHKHTINPLLRARLAERMAEHEQNARVKAQTATSNPISIPAIEGPADAILYFAQFLAFLISCSLFLIGIFLK